MTGRLVAAIAVAFTAFFAYLTLADAVRNGVSVLTIVSLAVLVLLGLGALGALTRPPDE